MIHSLSAEKLQASMIKWIKQISKLISYKNWNKQNKRKYYQLIFTMKINQTTQNFH